MIRAVQRALDVTQDRIDPGERRMPGAGPVHLRSRTAGENTRRVSPAAKHPKPSDTATVPGSKWHRAQVALSSLRNPPTRLRRILTGRPSRLRFHGGHERRLAWRAAPGSPPATLSAPVRIIDLHPAARRRVSSRSFITCIGLCLTFQAVL